MATILVGSTGFADDMIISGRTPCGGNRMVDVADLIDDDDFVLAMARFADGVWTESQIKRKFRFDDATWQKLGSDDRLVEKIEALKELRIRRGDTKRERAQQRVIQAPAVLENIMMSADASPKHRIDAAKALDAFANGPEAAAPAASAGQFLIQIVLSPNEIIRYPQSDDKTTEKLLDVSPKAGEHDTHDNDDAEQQLALPWGAFLVTNKQGGGGNGSLPV
jgi:hypothetical protein